MHTKIFLDTKITDLLTQRSSVQLKQTYFLYVNQVLGFTFIGFAFLSTFLAFWSSDFLVEFVQTGNIEFGLLEGLDLSDDSIAQRIDKLASLHDLLGELINVVEGLNQVSQVVLLGFFSDDFSDLLSNGLNLLMLGITGLSELAGLSSSESSDENSKDVAIIGFNFAVNVNEGLPFSNELAKLISGHIHSMEVSQAR